MFVINYYINEILHTNYNVYYFKGVYGCFKNPFFKKTKITFTTSLYIFMVSRK